MFDPECLDGISIRTLWLAHQRDQVGKGSLLEQPSLIGHILCLAEL
jgi:hypothetical protein